MRIVGRVLNAAGGARDPAPFAEISVFESHHRIAQSAKTPTTVKELWQAMVYVVQGLTAELSDAHQRIAELNEQALYVNHQLATMGRNLRKLAEVLYAPNEYYVVGQKG